jgi:Tfp pilus assembly protein PilN
MYLPAVDEIDFLPAGFHDRQRQRRARGWRWGFAAAFVGLAGLGLAGNRLQHARLEAARDQLAPQARAVADLDRQTAELHARIQSLGLRADLRALLRLRPAATRLLAAVAAPLPAHTTLTDLHFGEEVSPEAAAPTPPAPDQPPVPPLKQDLDRLTAASARHSLLTLKGVAPDDAAVSDYLAGLGRSGLFNHVRLLFTDRHDHQGHELRSFSVELQVRRLARLPASPAAAPAALAAGSQGGAP